MQKSFLSQFRGLLASASFVTIRGESICRLLTTNY